mmetsp:Transcript_7315/g.22899  ORF Transcript_7315/g.22899 Transcript_7315/m.22899 type:complete len:321 (+) Transcript_7315:102-1064(+)
MRLATRHSWIKQLLVISCLAAPSVGLHLDSQSVANGRGSVKPIGRHIQYRAAEQAGISDRIALFGWLTQLGNIHNATVHINGGANMVQAHLQTKHSAQMSSHWGHYVNISANGGNPFHAVQNFEGCKSVTDPETDFYNLFENGVSCVNIDGHLYHFKHRRLKKDGTERSMSLSGDVKGSATRFLQKIGSPQAYGAYHIRRCDRMYRNAVCTQVDVVRENILRRPDVKDWFLFFYAEEGYAESLKLGLSRIKDKRFWYEDEVQLNPDTPWDNYFTYLIGQEILSRAAVSVDTKQCVKDVPAVSGGLNLVLQERTHKVCEFI